MLNIGKMAELKSESFLAQQFNVWFCEVLLLVVSVGWFCLVLVVVLFGSLGFYCVLGFWLVGWFGFVCF